MVLFYGLVYGFSLPLYSEHFVCSDEKFNFSPKNCMEYFILDQKRVGGQKTLRKYIYIYIYII